ncbi:hypothetical protein B5X24_HaOG200736 [Helicoverpa armigera]|uniref:Gustatory receptor n=1 Tax=Helicoverpa armigera TaxID=29058 RepID=A0A2W1BWN0_HELAM|nr:hypothetical protein B5X24_HaOG200736 [Helicoverpa armigera]
MHNIFKIFQKKRNQTIILNPVHHDTRLDNEVLRIIYPFNFAFFLLLSSKYSIQDDRIMPIGMMRKCLSLFNVFYAGALSLFFIYFYIVTNDFSKSSIIMSIIHVSGTVTFSMGLTLIIVVNIVFENYNIQLIKMIQFINRGIDFSRSVKSFIIYNWVFVIFVFSIDLFTYIFFMVTYYMDVLGIVTLWARLMFISYDINRVYAIRIITLLRKYLDEWNKNVSQVNNEDGTRFMKLLEVYENILESFKLYKTIFQELVSIFNELNVYLL